MDELASARAEAEAGDAEDRMYLASVLAGMGRLEEAKAECRAALEHYRGAVAAGSGHLRSRLARALERQGRTDEALGVIRSAIDGGDHRAYTALGHLLAKHDRVGELTAIAEQTPGMFDRLQLMKGAMAHERGDCGPPAAGQRACKE